VHPSKSTSIKVTYDHQPIDQVVLPKISEKKKPLFVVAGRGNSIRNINVITEDFYSKYKEIIEVLSRGVNFKIRDFGQFFNVKRGDVKLVDMAFACLLEGKDWLKRTKCLWIFGENSSETFSPEIAETLAKKDYEEIMSGAIAKIPVHMLLGTLSEYQKLLEKENLVEEDMQKFLENNPVLISVDYKQKYPKFKLGEKYIIDFLVQTSDLHYILVEIESPNDPLYTKERLPKPSKELREADSQMKEYLSYVKNNILYLRNKLPEINVEKTTGLIIIGRSSRLTKKQLEKLEKDNSQTIGYKILTYDELATKMKTFLENLGIRYSPFA